MPYMDAFEARQAAASILTRRLDRIVNRHIRQAAAPLKPADVAPKMMDVLRAPGMDPKKTHKFKIGDEASALQEHLRKIKGALDSIATIQKSIERSREHIKERQDDAALLKVDMRRHFEELQKVGLAQIGAKADEAHSILMGGAAELARYTAAMVRQVEKKEIPEEVVLTPDEHALMEGIHPHDPKLALVKVILLLRERAPKLAEAAVALARDLKEPAVRIEMEITEAFKMIEKPIEMLRQEIPMGELARHAAIKDLVGRIWARFQGVADAFLRRFDRLFKAVRTSLVGISHRINGIRLLRKAIGEVGPLLRAAKI